MRKYRTPKPHRNNCFIKVNRKSTSADQVKTVATLTMVTF
jgi:hypothetical protein